MAHVLQKCQCHERPKKKERTGELLLQTDETKDTCRDFPGGAVVKNPPANAGDTSLIPGPGRSHMPQSN